MSKPAFITQCQQWQMQNHFAELGAPFYARVAAQTLTSPYLICHSSALFDECGFAESLIDDPEFLGIFSGAQLARGSQPLASVYSGHQFGVWAGQLGDGRALLLGDAQAGDMRWEFQLKGAGITPFSRMGDGRAVLRSSIREFLASEAMAALGVPTTRALCLVGSEQRVLREDVEKTAIVTRVSPSFLRFGHFEHFCYSGDLSSLRKLADFVIQHYYPECLESAQPYSQLLQQVCDRTADLLIDWQSLGFMHGVMNTDNMSILGLTLDYGPFGMMDGFDPHHICNHSDTQGRYRFSNQVAVALWNCHALAQSLMPLIVDVDAAHSILDRFIPRFEAGYRQRMLCKLGLADVSSETARQPDQALDLELLQDYLTLMQKERADYTLSFRRLSQISQTPHSQQEKEEVPLLDLVVDREAMRAWLNCYRQRLNQIARPDSARQTAMNAINPKYILRNHLAQIAIERAEQGDFSEVKTLLHLLMRPFDEQSDFESYAKEAPAWAQQLAISCSS